MGKNKPTSLNWDDFAKLGNPENAPILKEEKEEITSNYKLMRVRLHLEKKGRGGREAIVIKGIELNDGELNDISKTIKAKMGVGGSAKDGEIIIQGGDRSKITTLLQNLGFKDIKNSGG